ncbi:MAG TPA: hypothetical protein VMZ71_02180 [Gemmataceae bacterium]|nr:hypothetical protein [Gemmataceae bacterium]
MSLPQRNSGTFPMPAARTGSGQTMPAYEVLKVRVLIKLQDKLHPQATRRMPESLLRQTARQHIEQVVEADFPRMSRGERDRLIEDVLSEAFGFGPLEELFGDATVKEILVLGPQAIVARRDVGWVPTNVKFLDADHLEETLEKVAMHGEVVSPGLPPSAIDTKLPNGFRAVAVIPPEILSQPAMVLFSRVEDAPKPAPQKPTTFVPTVAPAAPPSGSFPKAAATPSGRFLTPQPRHGVLDSPAPGEGPLARHRLRITERLIKKMASLGVYDLQRVEITELRKIVTAYIREYCETEKILLSDSEQGRLMLEILTGMHR